MLYIYNKNKLDFELKTKELIIKTALIVLIISAISFYYGFNLANGIEKTVERIEYEPPINLREQWIDSVFTDYEKRANIYLERELYKDSPIKGYMLASAAKDSYLTTGIFLPVELAQAQIESSMGIKGRSPDTNPFNIGEFDSYTHITFKNTYDGIKGYYHFMTSNYLKCKSVDDLMKQFTNCKHLRYASAVNYEKNISQQYIYIKEYIDNCLNDV